MLARLVTFSAFAALLLTTGCNEKERVVALDLPPHKVDGVYSVTGDRVVTVRWRANQEDDIDFYRVYRNRDGGTRFAYIGASSGTSYEDYDVLNGHTYYYAVAAVDLAGQESPELSYEDVFDTPRPEGFNVTLTDTDLNDGASAWDFSARLRRSSYSPDADIYYDADVAGGHYLVFAAPGTLIQDAGYVNALDDIDFAPPGGWSADGVVEAIPNHAYVVLTRDNHYAKFLVRSRDGAAMLMDWAYQEAPANPELARRLP